MNNFNSFFDNLFPLRPLYPFVQSVLPTVFDDSLSYLETLGKVVKTLNDATSNVNTLEDAVRAFANTLSQYENLSITPVEITFDPNTRTHTASMTYSDIVSALNDGHTVIAHVTGSIYDASIDFYSAALKSERTDANVNVLYWDSPIYSADDNTVFYRAFINEHNTVNVVRRVIGGADSFVIHYDSDTGTADKTFSEIVAAIEAEKAVLLIADDHYISDAKWILSGDDQTGFQISRIDFLTAAIVPYTVGAQLGTVQYSVNDSDTWTVTRNGFPDASRINSMIDARIAQLEGFNSIAKLNYNESTGAVTYYDGEQTIDVTGYIINNRFLSTTGILPILEGWTRVGDDGALFAYYFPVRYGTVGNDEVVEFYRVYNGNYELVSVPWSSNIAVKTSTPIGSAAVDDIVWGYQDEDSGNAVIRKRSDNSIYTASQMVTDANARKLILIESVHGLYYLSGANTVLDVSMATFFNGGTYNMIVDNSGIFAETPVEYATPTPEITNTDTTIQISIDPNKFYVFPNAGQLTIDFNSGTNGIVNEYHFRFTSGSTATQLDIPATVNIPDDFEVAANTVYEVSIIDNYMVYSSWAVTV